jgi:hypothetical protein
MIAKTATSPTLAAMAIDAFVVVVGSAHVVNKRPMLESGLSAKTWLAMVSLPLETAEISRPRMSGSTQHTNISSMR